MLWLYSVRYKDKSQDWAPIKLIKVQGETHPCGKGSLPSILLFCDVDARGDVKYPC